MKEATSGKSIDKVAGFIKYKYLLGMLF